MLFIITTYPYKFPEILLCTLQQHASTPHLSRGMVGTVGLGSPARDCLADHPSNVGPISPLPRRWFSLALGGLGMSVAPISSVSILGPGGQGVIGGCFHTTENHQR
ncbi:hypothetical protein ILYODFUR_023704 [Ilyodon furcidens]|uniref:Uncharacterized protein n=1 Tax=Ilyodon furcidens TaxID=33524 RepID=A0ABV0TYE8_9TELE